MEILSYIDKEIELVIVSILAAVIGALAVYLNHYRTKLDEESDDEDVSSFKWRYIFIMVGTIMAFVVTCIELNRVFDIKLILYLLIISMFVIIIVIDVGEFVIPNLFYYLLTIFGTTLVLLNNNLDPNVIFDAVTSGFLYMGFGLMLFILLHFTTKIESIEFDHIKFLFVTGLMLGLENFVTFILYTGVFGVIYGTMWKLFTGKDTFPFAPSMCLSAFICLLYGAKIRPDNLIIQIIYLGV